MKDEQTQQKEAENQMRKLEMKHVDEEEDMDHGILSNIKSNYGADAVPSSMSNYGTESKNN